MTYPACVVLPPSQEYVVSARWWRGRSIADRSERSPSPGRPLLRLASPELGEQQLKLMEAAQHATAWRNEPCNARSNWHPKVSCPSAGRRTHRTPPPRSKPACDRLRLALRLAGLDAASIRRVAEGGAMQDALSSGHARGHRDRAEHRPPGQRVAPSIPGAGCRHRRKLWLDIQLPVERQSQVTARGGQVGIVGGMRALVTASLGSTVSDNQTMTRCARAGHARGGVACGRASSCRPAWPCRGGEGWAGAGRRRGATGRQSLRLCAHRQGFRGHARWRYVTAPVQVSRTGGRCAWPGDRHHVRDRPEAAWLGKGGGETTGMTWPVSFNSRSRSLFVLLAGALLAHGAGWLPSATCRSMRFPTFPARRSRSS